MVSPFKAADMLSGRSAQEYTADLLRWQTDVFDRILSLNPSLSPSIRNSQRIPLHYLPIQEQIAQVGKYRQLSGLNTVLLNLSRTDSGTAIPQQLLDQLGPGRAKEVHNIAEGLRSIKGIDAESPYFKVPVSYKAGDHPVEAVLASMNLGYNPRVSDLRAGMVDAKVAQNAASHFSSGPYSIRAISDDFFKMSANLKPGASFMSFDIETAGLMKGQIREVGYRTGTIDSSGRLGSGVAGQLLFDPIMLRRGTVGQRSGSAVKPVSISEFLRMGNSGNISDNFAQAMVPFLESMKQSDYIIGHNIQSFDLPQVYDQLTQTKAYKASRQNIIPGFRDLVDSTFADLNPKIVDTLTLAQRAENLTELTVHPQLMRMGAAQPYSISNLLLQTDLGERIGTDKMKSLLAQGLHNAEVDDVVTRGILEHMNDLQLKTVTDSGMIRSIISSSAITPFTNASVHSDISDKALKHLISKVDNGIFIPNTSTDNRELRALIESARSGNVGAKNQAFDLIRSGRAEGLSFSINPIQQQVFETRNLGLGVRANIKHEFDPTSYIFRNNLFDDMAYRGIPGRSRDNMILSQRSNISAEEFHSFQTKMKNMNMPFSGLSLEERRFGTALSHLTGGVSSDTAARSISVLTSDTLVSHFDTFNPNQVQYMTTSGRSSLPVSLLTQHGGLKEGDLLGLSVVDRTVYSKRAAVNLVYKFDSQDAANVFATKLERLSEVGDRQIASSLGLDMSLFDEADALPLEMASNFRAAVVNGLPQVIRETGATQGVSIGQLYGDKANPVIELLRQLNGTEQLKDEAVLPMKLPFAAADSLDAKTGDGVMRTAGAVLDSGLTPADLKNVGRNVGTANQVYGGLLEVAREGKHADALGAARMAAAMHLSEEQSQIVNNAFEAFQKARPHIPKALGIGAIAAFGIHEYKKHKENEPYNDLFDRSGPTTDTQYNVGRLLQQKKDMGIDLSRQGYNPLETAFVVDNLNSNRIGHTNMASNKNSALYGGII